MNDLRQLQNQPVRASVRLAREPWASAQRLISLANSVFSTLLAVCLLTITPSSLMADEDAQAIEAGREALDQGVISQRYPWYDPETDGIRRITIKPPPQPTATRPASASGPIWLSALGWFALGSLLVVLALALVYAFVFRDRQAPRPGRDDVDGDGVTQADRVDALPFRVKRPTSDLLAEARRCYEEGRYGEAIVYLFSHQLVELDKNHLIHLTRGKTNRQYMREIARRPTLRQLVSQTMVAFEDVFFGDHPLDRSRFENCWSELPQFDQLVREATA